MLIGSVLCELEETPIYGIAYANGVDMLSFGRNLAAVFKNIQCSGADL